MSMFGASGHFLRHQLMFSAILLHWNLYAPLPQSQRVTLEQWLEISDVEAEGERKNTRRTPSHQSKPPGQEGS